MAKLASLFSNFDFYKQPSPDERQADDEGDEDISIPGEDDLPEVFRTGEDLVPPLAVPPSGPWDLQGLLRSLTETAQGYGGKVPKSILEAQKFLVGQIGTQGRFEETAEATASRFDLNTAIKLREIAAANARSANAIGAANARSANSLAASWDRMVAEEEGRTRREEMQQEGQTLREVLQQRGAGERQAGMIGWYREKEQGENVRAQATNRIAEEANRIRAGELNLNTALGQLKTWLEGLQSSLPEGAEYVPGFQPGGPVQEAARLAGVSYAPRPATPVAFDPAALVRQTMGR